MCAPQELVVVRRVEPLFSLLRECLGLQYIALLLADDRLLKLLSMFSLLRVEHLIPADETPLLLALDGDTSYIDIE